jgi:hypothetical protein
MTTTSNTMIRVALLRLEVKGRERLEIAWSNVINEGLDASINLADMRLGFEQGFRKAWQELVEREKGNLETGTDSWATEEVEWTVYDRVPRNGVGLLSAVYGMFKTYVVMDLCGSVMAALPYLGKQIKRRCGVLLFAAEGASTVPLRLRALIEHRLAKEVPRRDLLEPGALDLEHLPFAFFGDCRPLLDPRTVEWMVGIARQAQEHFRAAHGIDLGIIAIDTMSAAAGWDSENDAAQAQIVMNHLADVSRETDTFVLAVDHFGQDVSKGSRGSTAKEAAADTIFYLRGKEVGDGEFTDTRLVLRKQRGVIAMLGLS